VASRVIAFAGPGESSPRNTKSLLNTWITDDTEVTGFFVPSAISKADQPGLANIVGYLMEDWADDEGDEDPFETASASKLVEALLDHETTDRYLIVVLGEAEMDNTTEALIKQARESGVKVLDLAAGLDEYTGGTSPAEPAAEEPEEPAERPRRRQRTTTTPEPEKAAEEPSEPRRTRGVPRGKDPDKTVGHPEIDPPFEPPYVEAVPPAIDTPPPGLDVNKILGTPEAQSDPQVRVDFFEHASTDQFKAVMIVALEGALAALKGDLGRPQEETHAYLVGEDGTILKRRGRGKPAAGQKVEFLTKNEAASRGFSEEN
jgi:hypothetical protein